MSKMLEPIEELTAMSACPADTKGFLYKIDGDRIGLAICATAPRPFRATAMELTASGIDVAAARKVTLETIVGILENNIATQKPTTTEVLHTQQPKGAMA